MNRQEVAALRAELRSPEVAAEVASRARSPEVGVGPELQASAACVRPVCIVLGLEQLGRIPIISMPQTAIISLA